MKQWRLVLMVVVLVLVMERAFVAPLVASLLGVLAAWRVAMLFAGLCLWSFIAGFSRNSEEERSFEGTRSTTFEERWWFKETSLLIYAWAAFFFFNAAYRYLLLLPGIYAVWQTGLFLRDRFASGAPQRSVEIADPVSAPTPATTSAQVVRERVVS